MSPNVNDEHPIPPEFDRSRPRDGRVRRCVIFGLCLLIPIGLLIAGIRLYLNISADARIDPPQDRYDILLARFEALDSAHSELAARFVKLNAAYIENQVRNISDHVTPRPNQKLLVEVPLSLMVTPEHAYGQMMNGDIMHDEFVAFAQTQHNIDIFDLVGKFFKSNFGQKCVGVLLFNLHYLNRVSKIQFGRVMVDTIVESIASDRVCTYEPLPNNNWNNISSIDQTRYTTLLTFAKWCGGGCPYDKCFNGYSSNIRLEVTIMEIC